MVNLEGLKKKLSNVFSIEGSFVHIESEGDLKEITIRGVEVHGGSPPVVEIPWVVKSGDKIVGGSCPLVFTRLRENASRPVKFRGDFSSGELARTRGLFFDDIEAAAKRQREQEEGKLNNLLPPPKE